MTGEALANLKEGAIEVLVDREESAVTIAKYAEKNGMAVITTRTGNAWQLGISKGRPALQRYPPCAVAVAGQAGSLILSR